MKKLAFFIIQKCKTTASGLLWVFCIVLSGRAAPLKTSSRPRRSFLILQDVFTTMVDMRWRYTLLAFAASFFMSWLVFAVIWYIICYVHGDFEEDHLPDKQVSQFAEKFELLFALQTQLSTTQMHAGMSMVYIPSAAIQSGKHLVVCSLRRRGEVKKRNLIMRLCYQNPSEDVKKSDSVTQSRTRVTSAPSPAELIAFGQTLLLIINKN